MSWALDDPATVERLFRATGGVVVTYGGVETYGHFEHVPESLGDNLGVLASVPSVVIGQTALPEITLNDETGRASGVGESITVGTLTWTVRGIEVGTSPGEIRVLLANR